MYLIYENILNSLAVIVAFICAITGKPVMVISWLFIFAVVSAIVMLITHVVKAVYKKYSDKAFSPAEEVKSEIQPNDMLEGRVIKRSSNEWIADIPAYVRKHQGHCYPLTKDDLKPRFTVKVNI